MGTGLSVPPWQAWQGSQHQLPSWPPVCLSSAWPCLSSLTPAWPGSCRSRGSTLAPASSALPSPRRTAWCTGRRASATTRGLDSTATWGMTARLTPSSTRQESTGSGSLVEITFPAVDRILLMPSPSTLQENHRNMIMNTTTTPSQCLPSSTLTILHINNNICWLEELSPLLGLLPLGFQPLLDQTDSSHQGRSSLTDSPRDSISTSSHSKSYGKFSIQLT